MIDYSRMRFTWYNNVYRIISDYYDKKDIEPGRAYNNRAIIECFEITQSLPFGELRNRVLMLIFGLKLSVEDTATELDIDISSVYRWRTDFIYLVAKRLGYSFDPADHVQINNVDRETATGA